MDIIPSKSPKHLTCDRKVSNYLLIIDAYYKTPKLYGMEKRSTVESMDNLDMFHFRFGEIDEF